MVRYEWERRQFICQGIVQGVGFRPFLHRLAFDLELTGLAYNTATGVTLELQGERIRLEKVISYIYEHKPPLAQIDDIHWKRIPSVVDEETFRIGVLDDGSVVKTFIGSDMGLCEDCERELLDENNRRFAYPFITCTNCGPRYSIIESIPYHREQTSMKTFYQCPLCMEEYTDIDNRRYHAEPNGCSDCGPSYKIYKSDSKLSSFSLCDVDNPITYAKDLVKAGYIVAIKGIGGYHLACDATHEKAVDKLRKRKGRPTKPFALMVDSVDTAKCIALMNLMEEELLRSQERPIVLLEKRDSLYNDGEQKEYFQIAPSVAPHMHTLGIMLPYAPIHYLLLEKESVWVMTSANYSGESLIYEDEEALDGLFGIADYILMHNRPIVAPCDDSICAVVSNGNLLYRRSRGYVPKPIKIPSLNLDSLSKRDDYSILAMGGDLKNVFAMNKGDYVLMGPHIGDLGHISTHEALEEAINRYRELFDIELEAIVCDAHPGYFSSRLGKQLSEKYQIPYIEVQHHEAHIGSVVCEKNLEGRILGICFDGTGYGLDGTIWGGEWIVVSTDTGSCERVSHLHEAPLLGGEFAVKEPWRQALWYWNQFGSPHWKKSLDPWIEGLPNNWELLERMMYTMPNLISTSAGRLFDAVGSILGAGYVHTYDGEIAATLEALSYGVEGHIRNYSYDGKILHMGPCIESILRELETVYESRDFKKLYTIQRQMSADFHKTLGAGIVEVSRLLCERYNINHVVVSGGVFQNRRLLNYVQELWKEREIIMPSEVSINDGGLALGQLWLGAKRISCV